VLSIIEAAGWPIWLIIITSIVALAIIGERFWSLRTSEVAPRDVLYTEPKHPYTGALLSAVPIANPDIGRQREAVVLEGDVPSPVNPPSGCRFHPRCPRFVEGHCDVEEPPLYQFGKSQAAACHYPLERWPMTAEEMRRAGSRTSAQPQPA